MRGPIWAPTPVLPHQEGAPATTITHQESLAVGVIARQKSAPPPTPTCLPKENTAVEAIMTTLDIAAASPLHLKGASQPSPMWSPTVATVMWATVVATPPTYGDAISSALGAVMLASPH